MCKPFAVLPVVLHVMRIFSAVFAFLLAAPAAHATAVADEHVTVELISEHGALMPGQTAWLGLRLEHAPQWHTYWINPGDSGLPTKLAWTLPAGYAAGDIAWPAPKRFKVDDLYNFGYDGIALLPVPIKVPADAQPGSHAHFAVAAKWLVCHEECVPGKAELTIDLPIAVRDPTGANPHGQRSAEAEALFGAARANLPKAANWQAQSALDGDRVEVTLRGAGLPQSAGIDAFATQTKVVANAPPKVEMRSSDLVLTFAKSDYFTSIPDRFELLLTDGGAHAWLVRAPFGTANSPAPAN